MKFRYKIIDTQGRVYPNARATDYETLIAFVADNFSAKAKVKTSFTFLDENNFYRGFGTVEESNGLLYGIAWRETSSNE